MGIENDDISTPSSDIVQDLPENRTDSPERIGSAIALLASNKSGIDHTLNRAIKKPSCLSRHWELINNEIGSRQVTIRSLKFARECILEEANRTERDENSIRAYTTLKASLTP